MLTVNTLDPSLTTAQGRRSRDRAPFDRAERCVSGSVMNRLSELIAVKGGTRREG